MSTTLPQNFSGVVPEFAQVADFGPPRSEIGIGCLMPWNGKLYILNYVSHRKQTGTGTGLRVIDGDFKMTIHPAAVDGTYANRMINTESSQLIIGPHVIDRDHGVRTVEALREIRLCGTATHLTDPKNLVYMLGMEGELFELNVHTLETKKIFDLTKELGTKGEQKTHFKDCYTGCGRLVVASNEYTEAEFLGKQDEGRLAEYDGKEWRILERNPYVCVQGLMGDVIFALGWDRASAILKVFTKCDGKWTNYRLPKASHTFDHRTQTEWPRIRSVEHERLLMDAHGMFYEMSPFLFGGRLWGVRPISTHLWVHPDFCTWKGLLVLGSDNASAEWGGNLQCAEPQSGLWFGRTDDLWKMGKPKGWGGPWWHDAVAAGVPSDPYLMTGFEGKCLHLSHESDTPARFRIEVDFHGNDCWNVYRTIEVPAKGYEAITFPHGYSAHWVRVVSEQDCTASAQFFYT